MVRMLGYEQTALQSNISSAMLGCSTRLDWSEDMLFADNARLTRDEITYIARHQFV